MNEFRMQRINPLSGLLFLALFLLLAYLIFRGLYALASFLAPVLLICTLIINYRIVIDYGKMLLRLLRENPIMGIIGILLTIGAFPLVIAFLFAKAVFYKKMGGMMQDQRQSSWEQSTKRPNKGEEYINFEEVVVPKTKKDTRESLIELPPLPKKNAQPEPKTPPKNNYEDLFD